MTEHLIPGPNMVLVQPSPASEAEEERPSGLLVMRNRTPDQEVEQGVVLAVGDKVESEWGDLEAGRLVFYSSQRVYPIKDNILIHCMAILAIERETSDG